MALHREEFTWPHLLPDTPVSSYLTVSPITSCEAGIFSVALVVTLFQMCPDVIRLAALWCSDFPLSLSQKRSPDALHWQGSKSITKSVEHSNRLFQRVLICDLDHVAWRKHGVRRLTVLNRFQAVFGDI